MSAPTIQIYSVTDSELDALARPWSWRLRRRIVRRIYETSELLDMRPEGVEKGTS